MGKPRTARWAVPLLTPVSSQIAAQERPALRRLAILERSTLTLGLPSRFPRDFARAIPDRTRSLINSRSNKAPEIEGSETENENDNQVYLIGCGANWRWSNCEPLVVGDVFPVEISGGTMKVSAMKNGRKLSKPIQYSASSAKVKDHSSLLPSEKSSSICDKLSRSNAIIFTIHYRRRPYQPHSLTLMQFYCAF